MVKHQNSDTVMVSLPLLVSFDQNDTLPWNVDVSFRRVDRQGMNHGTGGLQDVHCERK